MIPKRDALPSPDWWRARGEAPPVSENEARARLRRMLTLKEAAALLGVTPDNLRAAIARGSLRADKIGRDWFVTVREVERYRQEHRRG